MLKVLYEDDEILVVIKPAGVESQAAKRFAPDMVSEVKKHLVINKSCTPGKEPYVGVIHRLDKPVSGVMVYAKTKRAAAALSEQIQSHKMKKIYTAVVHGRPVNSHAAETVRRNMRVPGEVLRTYGVFFYEVWLK